MIQIKAAVYLLAFKINTLYFGNIYRHIYMMEIWECVPGKNLSLSLSLSRMRRGNGYNGKY